MPSRESIPQSAGGPAIKRMRLDPVRRNLIVRDVRSLSPHLVRVTLYGDELAGFHSPSPDDHIKLFFPMSDGGVAMRDYTPRHFDAKARVLTLEFFLHEGGVGSAWAQRAKPGDRLQIGGPRGSTLITSPGAWWLLIGDETALPSVGRRLEEMASATAVITMLAVAGADEELRFETRARLTSHWIHRPYAQAGDPAPFLTALSKLQLPSEPGFVWIAAEGEVARAIREYVVDTMGHSPEWIKASGYWSLHPEEGERHRSRR